MPEKPYIEAKVRLDLAVHAAHAAGDLLLGMFRGPMRGVSSKTTPTDLVSDADRSSEELILDMLRSERPEDGILSEEGGSEHSTSGVIWIVDPLDATVNYLFGLPWWCVSVAAHDREGALLGVIHNPNSGETFTAVRGDGAFLDGAPISVSDRSDISSALVGTGFSYDRAAREQQAAIVARLLPRVRDIRRAGSAALDLAHLACGRLDGYYEAPLEPWDRAAGVLMIEEAGGVVSELEAPLGLSTGVVAANPKLHDELRRIVDGHH
ncbi:MAG: inositol monophosphatase family protein [Actinomycetota bacterium]